MSGTFSISERQAMVLLAFAAFGALVKQASTGARVLRLRLQTSL